MTRWGIFKHNSWQALVSIDQALHNIGGAMWAGLALFLVKLPTGQTWADETLSSRCIGGDLVVFHGRPGW